MLQAVRLYHYQRSVAIRLCYCPCFLLCSRYHKCVTILFLKLECHPSDILVRLMRYEFTDIHQQGRSSPCLSLLLHMRRTEPHSTSSATASSCRSWNFFFASFLHVFPSAPSFFVSFFILVKSFLSNISLYFPDVTAKRLSFFSLSFAFACSCFRPYKIHPSIPRVQLSQRNDCCAHRMPLKQTANRSFRCAAVIFLLVLLPKFLHHCRWSFSHLCRDVLQAPLNAFC